VSRFETEYRAFLATKRRSVPAVGPDRIGTIHPILFPFQADLVRWAVRKGRAALFADTGLGKTFMQLEWARLIGERTLVVAPLSVARQTIAEGRKIGIDVAYGRADGGEPIVITNYEMVQHFDPSTFGAVVLDESSILKALDGKTRKLLTAMFSGTQFRLACTATPAPNDISEIGNHAAFLGVRTMPEMLAEFFVHESDGAGTHQGWRLKGHAEDAFYRWLASWSMSIRKPSDLGYDDAGYNLPPLTIEQVVVPVDYVPEGQLFFGGLKGITDRSRVRRQTVQSRVGAAAALVNASSEQWIVWHGLNDEGYALRDAIPGAVLVEGADSPESKAAALEAFQDGTHRVLVTKPRIAGFGMNFQNAHRMAFVGLSDSWEAYYQAVRRCWRFGQMEPVTAHVVVSEAESAIYENVMRKEEQARDMAERLIKHVELFERDELAGREPESEYRTAESSGSMWRMLLGDSTERLAELADDSVDMSVFSPPFSSLYTYSASERDLGNSANAGEFWTHFGYIIGHLLRVTKPGRNVAVHVAQVPMTMVADGAIAMRDFRGDTVREFVSRGFVFHGEVTIDKDPQAQAIRTKSKGLLFVQKERDRSWLRPAIADYILVFRKPGENMAPIVHDQITNDEWISWARPIWYGINEYEVLNYIEAREQRDEKHIAALQLETIRRCVRLWSNPGELVLSPFAGIGSEGYVAVELGRRFVGIELKRSYYEAACRNIARAGARMTLGLEEPAAV